MQLHQSIVIESIRDNVSFISAVYFEASKRGWVPRRDLADSVQGGYGRYFCIESPSLYYETATLAGIVWFRIENGRAESFNIVPTSSSQLTVSEYNYLMGQLYSTIFIPGEATLNVKLSMTRREMDIRDYIYEDGLSALKRFSLCANKATGSRHPSDLKLWCEFLILLHKKKYKLDPDKLSAWFYENGWYDGRVVEELIKQYEFSIGLLDNYDGITL